MKQADIDAVKMVRAIRERHASELKGKAPDEVIAFYNSRGRTLQAKPTKLPKGARRSA